MLYKAKEKACYDILIEKDIVKGIMELDEKFDLIACIDVLVYFGDLNEFFNKVTRCLPINGLLCISIEVSDQDFSPYILQSNGRYQHTKKYIIELAQNNQLTLLNYKSVVGRHRENQGIQTGLFIFKKIK